MEFYLDPAKRLDSDFLSDLNRIAFRQRVVLMTDTYEQMTALDDWMRVSQATAGVSLAD